MASTDRLYPAAEPINNGQKIAVALGRWEGPHEVQIERGEAGTGRGVGLKWGFDVTRDFRALARHTGTAIKSD